MHFVPVGESGTYRMAPHFGILRVHFQAKGTNKNPSILRVALCVTHKYNVG